MILIFILTSAKRHVAITPEDYVAEGDEAEDCPPSKSVLIEGRIGVGLNSSFGFVERPSSLHGGFRTSLVWFIWFVVLASDLTCRWR